MHAEELRAGHCPLAGNPISEREMRTRFVLLCQASARFSDEVQELP
jgi:hypothetical protein